MATPDGLGQAAGAPKYPPAHDNALAVRPLLGRSLMTVLELVLLLTIAAICGAIGKAIAGYWPFGILVSIAVGFVGALIGTWFARLFGLPELLAIHIGQATFPIVWAILGSALFVALMSLFAGRRRRFVEVP